MVDHFMIDMDGTVIDSKVSLLHAVKQSVIELGLPERTDEIYMTELGLKDFLFFEHLYNLQGEELQNARQTMDRIYSSSLKETERPFAGIEDWLQDLKASGAKVYSCSVRDVPSIKQSLDNIGLLGLYDGHVGLDQARGLDTKGKSLQYTLEQNDIGADRAIMVGDKDFDIEAARYAGVPVVGVTYGYGSHEELAEADYLVDTVEQLRKLTLGMLREEAI